MVVEDDPELLDLWRRALARGGYHVEAFGNFPGAKQYLVNHRPDAILTDIRLGPYNGLQLVVLAKARNPKVVAAVITGFDDPVLRKEAEKQGAWYLTKPMGDEGILAFLRSRC